MAESFAMGLQSADKAHKRKNCSDKMKMGGNFCFLRQLHLHPAVTYVYVSSLGCKCSFLGLQAFSALCQSVDFVNILNARTHSIRAFLHAKRLPFGRRRVFYSLSVSFSNSR